MPRIPFDPAEIENAKETVGMMGRIMRKYATPVTPKENYKMVYRREVPHWLPQMSDITMMTPRIDPDNVARAFVFEANPLSDEEKVGGVDKFGVEWVYVPVAQGSMVKPGNPLLEDVNDWKEKVRFPDVDAWDWEGSKKANADFINNDNFIVVTILTGFFERLISFMDFDKAAVALIDEDQKDAIHELFDALADVYIKMVDHFIDAYHLDCLSLHDDWGSQRSPFFSLATVREMIVPYIKKVADYCHSRGVFFELHSCGKNEKLVPAYIEAGVDAWSGQPMNDKEMLYEQYGGRIILGVEPDCAPKEFTLTPVDPEIAVPAAKRFVAKYCPNYAEKPVTVGFFFGPPEYSDTLYAESRKAFS